MFNLYLFAPNHGCKTHGTSTILFISFRALHFACEEHCGWDMTRAKWWLTKQPHTTNHTQSTHNARMVAEVRGDTTFVANHGSSHLEDTAASSSSTAVASADSIVPAAVTTGNSTVFSFTQLMF